MVSKYGFLLPSVDINDVDDDEEEGYHPHVHHTSYHHTFNTVYLYFHHRPRTKYHLLHHHHNYNYLANFLPLTSTPHIDGPLYPLDQRYSRRCGVECG
jgi:hypothetical protein